MSDKGKYPKNVVRTRAKGKSKESGDSNAVKPKTQNDKNYETDEPVANTQVNRRPDREYSSDVPLGGPQSGTEGASASVAAQAERLRQLAPAARSLTPALEAAAHPRQVGPAEQVLTSDAESIRSMRRPSSQLSQQSTVKRKKVKQRIGVHDERRDPDGVTGGDTGMDTAAESAPGPSGMLPKAGGERSVNRRAHGYRTEDDQLSLRSDGSATSRRSGLSLTSTLEEEVLREVNHFRNRMAAACQRRGYETDRQNSGIRRLREALQAGVQAVDGPCRARVQQAASRGNQPQRSPARQRSGSRHSQQDGRYNDGRGRQLQQNQLLVAAGAGAPGGDDDDDGADSDRDWYRRHQDRHVRDAARRRAARMSDNQDSCHPPSRSGHRPASVGPAAGQPAPGPGLINQGFDAGRIAADAVAVASAALQALAPARMNIEQINLPKFNGADFLLFHKQFEAVAAEQQWSPQTRARKLLECLEGDTRRHVEAYMTEEEMLEALRQYYAGSRPSIEAKNILRHYSRNRDETIEAFASRIQAFADGARLTPFDKKKYMQEAFMNGIKSDTKMQRYIEKRTSQDENVHIVKLLKAAQDYLHDKQGSTQTGNQPKAKFGKHKQKAKGGGQNETQPQCNVAQGSRKEPLTHEDESVEPEVEEEQQKVNKEKNEKKQSNNQSWKQKLVESHKANEVLQEQLKKAIDAMAQQQAQVQPQNWQPRGQNFRNNNNNNNNWSSNNSNWGGNGGQNQRNGNYRGNFRNDGQRNDGYRSDGGRSGWRGNPNYQDMRSFNNSNFNQGPPPQQQRQGFNRPPPQAAGNAPPPAQNHSTSGQPAQQAAPSCNKHEVPSQTDRYGGIDPSVYPEGDIYSGSSSGSQA